MVTTVYSFLFRPNNTTHTALLNPPSSNENNAVSTGDKSCIATQ